MTQSELILHVLGTNVDEVIQAHNEAKEKGETVLGFVMPLPSIKIMDLPVVFSSNVKEVGALISTVNQEARSNEVQTPALPTPITSDRNEQDPPEPSVTVGDGNGEDRRDDKHTPPPVPRSGESEEDTDTKSPCHFV